MRSADKKPHDNILKTFLCAVYCCAKAVLYPHIVVISASANVKQAKQIFEKISDLAEKHPMLKNEIAKSNFSKDSAVILWKSGAKMKTVVSGDGSRGERCQILILDESRLMKQSDVVSNLEKFLTGRRDATFKATHPDALKNEKNTQVYLTSIGYKDEWSYKLYEEFANHVSDGRDDYGIVSMPYQFGVECSIITEDFIEKQLLEKQVDPKIFRMEMEVIPYGETDGAVFKYDDLKRAQQIIRPLIPISDKEYIKYGGDIRKAKHYVKKEPGEIRVLVWDIAIAAGSKNDNSAFEVFRLFDNGDHYKKYIPYVETMNGVAMEQQVLHLKRLFYDLECDYVVVDAGGGLGYIGVEQCGKKTYDPSRDRFYPGWRTYDMDSKFDDYVSDEQAEPVMFCMQTSSASTSNEVMAHRAQLEFEMGRVQLLVSPDDAYDELNDKYDWIKYSTSNVAWEKEYADQLMSPFINTEKLLIEAMNTKMVKKPSGAYKFEEASGRRKDLIVCMMYGIFFISKLEMELSRKKRNISIQDYGRSISAPAVGRSVSPFGNNIGRLGGFGRR